MRSEVQATYLLVSSSISRLLPASVVEHVGSTAVPGAWTKGDLDLCVIVEREGFAEADRVLSASFARNVGSLKTDSLSSFVDEQYRVPVGIQLVVSRGPYDFFVRWRDLLRAEPNILSAYNSLKQRWQGRGEEHYRTEKSAFIKSALAKAGRFGVDAG